MPVYEKKIISGNVTEICMYFSLRKVNGDYLPRIKNISVTPEEKQVINIRESRRKLTRLLNCNFTGDDLFLRLSYKKEPAKEDAIKSFRNFIRRLKYYIKKRNLPELKYIAVTERAKGRYHHHIVMNFDDVNVIRKIWENGGVYCINLWSEDYEGLAKYITKETIRLERGKRWSQSRNLKKPVVIQRELKREKPKGPSVPKNHILLESECYTTTLGHKTWYIKTVHKGEKPIDGG